MRQPLKVLLLEDNERDAELIRRMLVEAGYEPVGPRVETEADYVAALQPDLDLILSDYHMPAFTGLRALHLLQERQLDIPFVIVSGTIGEDTAVEAMRQGAADYLLKDRLARLPAAIARAMHERQLRRERHEIEVAWRESELRLRTATDAAQVGLAMVGEDRRYCFVNAAYARLLRRPPEELAGRLVAETLRPAYDLQVAPYLARACAGEPATHPLELSVEGHTRHYSVSYQPGRYGGRTVAVVVVTDVTEWRQMEEARRASERRLQNTLDHLLEGCVILGHDWRYLYANEAAAQQGRRTVAEMIGRRLTEAFPGIETTQFHEEMRRCMSDRSSREIEERFAQADRVRWLHFVIQPVPEGLFVFSLDITMRKLAEEEVQRQLSELQRWHALMTGREERVLELKREVNELRVRLGLPTRYREIAE